MRLTKLIIPLLITASLLTGGCRKSESTPPTPSPRIVSYSPALTDLLYDMELGEHVVGVTKYCQPPGGSNPSVVGDHSNISAEAILAVEPDVVFVQQNPAAFGALVSIRPDLPIEHFDIETLGDIATAMERIGELTGKKNLAAEHITAFNNMLQAVRDRVASKPRPKVLVVENYEMPSTGGAGTFVDEVITTAGGVNAAALRNYKGWKRLNIENILAMEPDVLVCQVSPGYEQKAIDHWRKLTDLPAVRTGRVFTVTDRRWTIPSMRSAEVARERSLMIHPMPTSQGAGE